ncbi:MAG: RHS repeat protein, partial [Gammaproteobacteria bacterium]|nr:RHS repeat protein [Gammaproteobacteria bacterium]
MTTLFENRQSAFQGVQENFVNTSAGNLTFLVRDLVRVGGMPIVVGRVYDSALAGGDAARDFGPGWKLAVRESLSEHGGRLVYTDASNAEYLLEVNGGDIVPAVPALAPVSSGRLHRTPGFSVAELRAGDMVRHFVKRHPHGRGASSRPDGPWRLTLVRHPRGWLRIDWRGELVAGLESDAGTVAFDRRADGRIVAARDDLGRAVGYDYDERGRLAAVTDLAGGLWSYGYDAEGALTAVADPRGKTVLAASHADGRTATVRALHAETAFHYGNGTTRAVDGLGRTTTFHRNPDGITTGVADAAGRLAQVAFDAELRPVSVSRDGAAVAYMDYDAAGRLAALRRPDGDSTFGHGDHGLTSVDGAETARYRYAAGRLVHAADAGGERGYAYTDDGVLASATAGGVETELATRPNGVVHELRRDGERLLGIEHRPDGRVVSMARGDGGVPNTVRYDYDARGFRTAAEYGGRVSSALGYDAAGNLVRYELATGGRTVLSQDYEIGDYNEVVRIRTGEGPDVSYEYDSAGRLTTALAGTRTATVAYDDLDRAVRVGLDGGTLATYGYAREDADAALAADRITSATPVPAGTSAVFGTMETVVYTRPAPMHFGPVVYEPALRTFVATHRHLVPDAVLASSLDRRMLPWRGGDVDGRPFGTDKPSGSLFIPPEYRSVNCFVCTASLESVSVSVTVVPVAGVSLSIILGAGGTCMIDEGGSQGGGFGAPVGPSWSHSVTFGDGGTATATGAPATAKHTYASPGEYEIRSDVTCSPCLSVLVLGTATETVEVKQCADSGSPTKIKTLSISAIPREYPDFIKGGHAWGTTRVG